MLPLISRLILVHPNRQHNLHSLVQPQSIDRLEGQVCLVTVHAIESDAVSDLRDEHHVVDDRLEGGAAPRHHDLCGVIVDSVEGLAEIGVWSELGDGWSWWLQWVCRLVRVSVGGHM